MRFDRWIRRVFFAAVLCIAVVESVIIYNLARINERNYRALRTATSVEIIQKETLNRLQREAVSRVALYNELIKRDVLLDGMVIHLDEQRNVAGECDSLLFSSLRYVALLRAGLADEAAAAWESINKSRQGGFWFRHPRCRDKSLSRDMMMGLLIALNENPPGTREVLVQLLEEIDRRNGYFSDGPFFVSYLSPGIAGLLRHLAARNEIPFESWPWALKQSFSSIEFDALFVHEGYESHLAALGVWLEWKMMKRPDAFNPRSMLGEFQRLLGGASPPGALAMDHQRLQWISSTLAEQNQGNLFFQWIETQVMDRDSIASRIQVLSELLNSPQFPVDRLPRDCDHDSDYVWQRKMAELLPIQTKCRATWNGVDFMWLAGLVMDDRKQSADGVSVDSVAH